VFPDGIGVGGSGSSLARRIPNHDGGAVMNGARALGLAGWEVVPGPPAQFLRMRCFASFEAGHGGAGRDLLKATQSFVDCLRIGKGVKEIRRDDHDVGALCKKIGVLAAHALAEVEVWAGSEGVEFTALLHIV